jgi:hypothetical protein
MNRYCIASRRDMNRIIRQVELELTQEIQQLALALVQSRRREKVLRRRLQQQNERLAAGQCRQLFSRNGTH